jgi:hypothetical protein
MPYQIPTDGVAFFDDTGTSQIQRTNKLLSFSNDNGTTFSPFVNGTPASQWFTTTYATIVGLLPLANTPVFVHEMESVNPRFSATVGGLSSVGSTGTAGGVIRVQTGATGGATATMRTIDSTATLPANQVANLRTDVYAVAVRAKKFLVNNSCDLRILQMGDEATTDIRVGINGAASQTTYNFKVGAGASTDTGVTQSSTYDDLVLTADGTILRLYINGVLSGAQVQSGVGAVGGHYFAFAANGGTASNVGFDIDKLLIMTVGAV